MRRAIPFLLAFLLLLPVSCGFSFSDRDSGEDSPESLPESAESGMVIPEQDPALSPGLYELLRFDNNRDGNHFSSFAVHGGEAAVYATRYDNDTGVEENELYFIDLESGKVSERILMEPWYDPEHRETIEPDEYSEYPAFYLYQLAVGENGTLVLYNPNESWAALYDHSGHLLDMIPYGPIYEGGSFYGDYPLLPRSCYTGNGFGYVSFRDDQGKEISAFSFDDDPNAVLLFENDYSGISTGKGRDIVCIDYGETGASLSFRVLDLKEKTARATVTLPPVWDGAEASWSDRGFYLGENSALIAAQVYTSGESSADHGDVPSVPETDESGAPSECVELLYLWRFDDDEAVPLDAERATSFSFHQKNLALRDEIFREYEISLHLDEAPPSDFTPWDDSDPGKDPVPSTCITGASKLEQYRILLALKRFLSKLPDGFTHEMYTDYPSGGRAHESFDIYVVKEIPGSAAAFASGFSQEEFSVCLATDEFSDSHLPHEFMHLIEVRIHDFSKDAFWDEWDSLNPDGYQYGNDDYRPDWFVTWYATTNSMEDRADTFMRLWQDAELPSEERDHDVPIGIRTKMRVLIDAIRAAYPSVEAVGKAFWEA